MISRHCKSKQKDSIATDRGNKLTSVKPIYTFSSASQVSLKGLLLALQSKGSSSAVKIETEEDMICESNVKDESVRLDTDMAEYQTQPKAFDQSQLQNIGFSSQRTNFDTSFISQRNHILEGHKQVKNGYCIGRVLHFVFIIATRCDRY